MAAPERAALRSCCARSSSATRASGSAGAASTVAKGEETVRQVEHSGVTYVTTDISRGDFQEYYNGFANRMLWPILHYRLDLAEFSSRDMAGYLRVNEHVRRPAAGVPQARRRDLGARLSSPAARQGAARARRREQDRLLPAYSVSAARPADRAAQARAHHPQPVPLRSGRLPDRQRRRQSGATISPTNAGCRAATAAPSSPAQRTMRIGVFPVGVEMAEFERLARRASKLAVRARGGRAASPTAA